MNMAIRLTDMSKCWMAMLFAGIAMFTIECADAEQIAPEIQLRVEKYKTYLLAWAANPVLVSATRKENKKGGIRGMSNFKWDGLSEKDPVVKNLCSSEAAKLLATWENDAELEKMILRDINGNLVAFSNQCAKPLLYNNAQRQSFKNGLKGAWAENAAKPDPSTQKYSVQISAPVMDGSKVIGVLHSAVRAD